MRKIVILKQISGVGLKTRDKIIYILAIYVQI